MLNQQTLEKLRALRLHGMAEAFLRLGQRYSSERLEAAATRAVSTGACSYRSVKSMLERGLDRQPLEAPATRPPLEHDNLRGAAYFDPSDPPRVP